jgi:hypothetical protein
MPYQELGFQPGVDLENTSLTNKGRWVASNWVRFRSGKPEKVGGWTSYLIGTYVGICRFLFNWITLANQNFLAVGTNEKIYIEYGQGLYDITPIRQTFNVSNNFNFTISSAVVKIAITAHGSQLGDWVDISGMTGGPYAGITVAQLNTGFKTIANPATGLLDANNVFITVSSNATSTVANTGGTNGVTAFEVSIQLPIELSLSGWGSQTWGQSAWGQGISSQGTGDIGHWRGDAFGQDLFFNQNRGGIYYWPATYFNTSSRAIALSAYSSDPNVPTSGIQALVTDYRHAVVFGTQPLGSATLDQMYIRWSDQENISGPSSWTALITNQAGGYRLTDGSEIMTARKTRQEILIWTNSALYSMQFTGVPYTYGFFKVGSTISLMSHFAMATVGGATTFWMGIDKFYVYNGTVAPLPCALRKYVFTNINLTQTQQVFAFSNERFNEVWWGYVSISNLNGDFTPDSYVKYNYLDNVWDYGTFSRTMWLDTPLRNNPVAAGKQTLFYQEYGVDDLTIPASPVAINAFIESADIDIMQGDKFAFIKRIAPDVSFLGSTVSNPQCNLTLSVRRYPGAPYDASSVNELNGHNNAVAVALTSTNFPISTTAVVEQYTQALDTRLRGRFLKLRVDSNTLGSQWQLGTPLAVIQPDGKR